MRMITAQAGCNLASVNYHFGNKDALIHEVFKRRLTVLNLDRLRALDEMERASGGEALKPSQIVHAFFGPSLRLAADTVHGGHTFMRLLSRTYTDPTEFVRTFLAEEYAEVVARFMAALYRALPDVPQAEILWRFHFMLGAMSYALTGTDALQLLTDRVADEDPAAIGPRLMSFLLGGLRAPLPELSKRNNRGRATRKVA